MLSFPCSEFFSVKLYNFYLLTFYRNSNSKTTFLWLVKCTPQAGSIPCSLKSNEIWRNNVTCEYFGKLKFTLLQTLIQDLCKLLANQVKLPNMRNVTYFPISSAIGLQLQIKTSNDTAHLPFLGNIPRPLEY